MVLFSCGSWIYLVLLFALCCATSADARTGILSSRVEATNQEPVSSTCITQIKIPTPVGNLASKAQFVQPSIETELRYAPSGPDPMHHHASPKKPEAP